MIRPFPRFFGNSPSPGATNARLLRGLSLCLGLAVIAAHPAAAAPVPPTDNTSGPSFGVYEWGLQDQSNLNESRTKWLATSLNRSNLWVEDFLQTDSWAHLEGDHFEFDAAYEFLRQNPDAFYVLSPGMFPGYKSTPSSGISLAAAAANSDVANDYLSHFVKLAQNLVTAGIADQTVLRIAHEFNGNWYAWKVVTAQDASNFAIYWGKIVAAMRAVPGASGLKFCWNVAGSFGSSYPISAAYPGDSYVDYVGIDMYDAYYGYTKGQTPSLALQQTAWNYYTGNTNNNFGVLKALAVSHGKPLAIGEWGLIGASNDHPGLDDTYFIQQMYNFIQDPANNVAWHIYFDVWANDGNHQINQAPSVAPTAFPNSAALFQQLFSVAPFTVNNDIGTTAVAGGCTSSAVTGAGAGFVSGGTSDSFHLASEAINGDTLCLAEITSAASAATAQSGLMIRAGAGSSDLYAALFLSNGKLIFQSRTTAAGAASQNLVTNSVAAPVWLKLLRRGNAITGYQSTDGLNWTYAGGQTVSLPAAAYAGAAVSSGSASVLNTMGIDSVNDADIPEAYYDTATSKETAFTPAISSAIIIDSADTTAVTKTGTWTASGTSVIHYGGTILTSYSPNSGAKLTFTPTIPTAGQYDVYITAPGNYQDGDQTPVTITSASGTSTVYYNEQGNDALWVRLGTYDFLAGTTGKVAVSNTGTVGAVGGHGFVTVDAVMFVPVPTGALPVGWTDSDIGGPTPTGSATYAGGTFTIKGGGSNIYYVTDQFNYAYQSETGDNTLITRVTGVTNTSTTAKAALMFRDSTANNADYVLLDVKPAGGLEFYARKSVGASATYFASGTSGVTPSPTTPVWIKLVKTGSSYSAFYSTSVTTPTSWTQVGTAQTVSLSNTIYLAGLAVCSVNTGSLNTCTFDNFSAQ